MKRKLNCDPRTNPVTTSLGALIVLPSLYIIFGGYFTDLKDEPNYWVIIPVGAIGIGLIIAPDKVFGIIWNGFKGLFKKLFG